MQERSQAHSADEISIIESFIITRTLIRIANSTDAKDWETLRTQLADEVQADFGHIRASQPMRADDLITRMKQAYSYMTTQHMVTNHDVRISGETAKVVSYGWVLHRQIVSSGGDFWCLHCRYNHDLMQTDEGWKVTSIQMTPILQQGNTDLVRQAFVDLRSDLYID